MGNCHSEGKGKGGVRASGPRKLGAGRGSLWYLCSTNKDLPVDSVGSKTLKERKSSLISSKQDSDVDTSCSNDEKRPPDIRLIEAVQKQEWKEAKELAQSVPINTQDKMGCTALMWAIGKNNLEMVKYFVDECKADVNVRDNKGDTALIMAAYNGHPNTVKFLIEETNADMDIPGEDGLTALEWAEKVSNIGVVACIKSHKKKVFSNLLETDTMAFYMLHPTLLQALAILPPTVRTPEDSGPPSPSHI